MGSALLRAQFSEGRARPESLREMFFVVSQARADAVVEPIYSIYLHFTSSLLSGPALLGHAISGYFHPGAVVAHATVDENLLTGVVTQQEKKSREMFIARAETTPWEWDILHSESRHNSSFTVTRTAEIHNNVDAKLSQVCKALLAWLRAAIQRWGHLGELRDTSELQFGGGCMVRFGMRMMCFGTVRFGMRGLRGYPDGQCQRASRDRQTCTYERRAPVPNCSGRMRART